jgi:hypothetical protein
MMIGKIEMDVGEITLCGAKEHEPLTSINILFVI